LPLFNSVQVSGRVVDLHQCLQAIRLHRYPVIAERPGLMGDRITAPLGTTGDDPMRLFSFVIAMFAALIVTGASAQTVNLTGKYRCVQGCRFGLVGNPAYVTQNRWDLNVVNEAGEPSRAWMDWFSPSRIWIENWNQGAVFSPNGMIIQFEWHDLATGSWNAGTAAASPLVMR
jgi:hypothetical protein